MAPGSIKRKRSDRQNPQDEPRSRPSPHHPENLSMAQQGHGQANGGWGRGRGGGGPGRSRGRGGNATGSPRAERRRGSLQSRSEPAKPQNQEPAPAVAKPSQPEEPIQRTIPAVIQPDQPADEQTDSPIFDYTYLTDDVVQAWQESAKTTILTNAAQHDGIEMSILLQELVRSALDARLQPEEVGATIKELIAQNMNDDLDVQSTFLDVVSLLDEKDTRRAALFHIIAATDIDPDVIRLELDVSLLQQLQLVRSTFDRMRTRKTTNVLYRQANFNLLREESEGYAKLITEYYNLSQNANSEGADPNMGHDAFNRIMALVGAFDLDVGRVLDITLDISANSLVKAYRFFVKFYRCSSWWPQAATDDNIRWEMDGPGSLPGWAEPDSDKWQYDDEEREEYARLRQERDVRFFDRLREVGMDAFFEIGARKIVDFEATSFLLEQEIQPELDSRGREINVDLRKRINENRKYMRDTKTLPPQGNADAAQLLGFKLSYYASPARDVQDVLPDNLVYLAALLIKIGFISLRDLYPHLYPLDEGMEDERQRLQKEKEEQERKDRPGGGANALAKAGALADDTVPQVRTLRNDAAKSGGTSPKPERKDDEQELPRPVNQKILLLKALLAIGALPEAMFILGRFPWLVDVDTSLPPYLHRIANRMLSKVAQLVRPLRDRASAQVTQAQLVDTTVEADGTIRILPRPGVRLRKWLGLDRADNGDGWEERHYYNDWDDNVPVAQDLDDFYLLCNTFFGLLGAKIGQDVHLFTTILRLVQHGVQQDGTNPMQPRWFELIRRTLIPALSLSKHNPGVVAEMWKLLEPLSAITRFTLYEEWYIGKTARLPDVKSALDRNRAEVKDVLRRMTNENGEKQARALTKVSLSSPAIAIMTFVNQLESYSNMIPGLVDSVRYFSPLANDTLIWVLIRSLSGQGRNRIQADGMLTSAWLQALSQFVASLFTKYEKLNAAPVLQYIASELRNGDSTNLEIIDRLIAEMAGIRSEIHPNDHQLLCTVGGPYLRKHILEQLGDARYLRQGSARRLMNVLATTEIAGQILISIAQERMFYSHCKNADDMPLKVIGSNIDTVQQSLNQYIELLRENFTVAEFEKFVPGVVELVGQFGLSPSMALTICRAGLAERVAEARKHSDEASKTSQDDTTMADAGAENGTSSLPPMLEQIKQGLPEVTGDLSERVSMSFYVTFWTLSTQDVYVNADNYTTETGKIIQQLKDLGRERVAEPKKQAAKDLKKAGLHDAIASMNKELSGLVSGFKSKRMWLAGQRTSWFTPITSEEIKTSRHLNLLQECFLPRSMQSALDAFYCFHLLKIMHSGNTPGFSLLALIEQLMDKNFLSALTLSCTITEAGHFGRFLCEILTLMAHWHSDKNIYNKEALGNTGDQVGLATAWDEDGKVTAVLEFEDFRRKLFEWHTNIKDFIVECWKVDQYMQVRNSVAVLKPICTVFPALKFHGKILTDVITPITLNIHEQRKDLKLAAASVLGPMRSREKQWVIPQAFRMSANADDDAAVAEQQAADEAAAQSKLNAAAAEFKPETNGERKGSAEDGEIEDTSPNKDVQMEDVAETVPTEVKEVDAPEQKTKPQVPSLPAKPERQSTPLGPKRGTNTRPTKDNEQYKRLKPDDDRAPSRDRSRERQNDRPAPHAPSQRDGNHPPARPQPVESRSFRSDRDQPRLPQAQAQSRPGPRHDNPATNSERDNRGINPERAQIIGANTQAGINPERAALINGDAIAKPTAENKEYQKRDGDHRSDLAPTGPRAGRPAPRPDLFESGNGQFGSTDSGRGRLNRESGHQETSYGRLNGGQDVPRPPNGPSGRPPRPQNAQSLNTRASDSSLQSTARQDPPTPTRNTRQRQADRAPASVPTTPAAENAPAIHPSRLANLGVSTPTVDTNTMAAPPSGPRSQNRPPPGTPTGPSPTNSVPTGPGFSGNERQRRSDRPRSSLGSASAANGPPDGPGNTFRGPAMQQSQDHANVPNRPPAPDRPAPRIDPGRAGLIQQNEPERKDSSRGNLGGRPSRGSSRERRDDQRHPPRHDDSGPRPPQGMNDQYGYQQPQHMADNRQPRRGRDDEGPPRRPPPNAPPNGGFQGQQHDNRGQGRGFDGRAVSGPARPGEDFRGPRRPDEGRPPMQSGPESGNRKRRHEDGPSQFDQAKRRQSGR